MSKAIDKYLARYAEPEAHQVDESGQVFQHLVCIPAAQEPGSLLETLKALAEVEQANEALVIVLINGSDSCV